jgi:hypothetical protein
MPSPTIPGVKPEAEQTAQVHKGGRMNRLIHSYAIGPASARPVPRVKPEAEQTASIHTGKRMKPIVHSGLFMNGIISEPAAHNCVLIGSFSHLYEPVLFVQLPV